MTRLTWIFTLATASALTGSLLAQSKDVRNDLPQPYRTTRDWGQLPPGVMKWPALTAIEAGPDGIMYVITRCFEDVCAGRTEPPILKYDASGKLLKSWGQGMFVYPHGASIDKDGNLWVTDGRAGDGKGNQIFKFNPDGKVLMTIGKAGVSGNGPDVFDQPTDVVVASNGDIFVTDGHRDGSITRNNRVVKFTKDGKFVKQWGQKGSGPGDFLEPHSIVIDSRGRVLVGDRGNSRVQVFDQDGKYITEWRQFGRPSGLAIASDDTLYVTDSTSGHDGKPDHTNHLEIMGINRGIRIGSARTGTVTAFIEDMDPTRNGHSGAEGVAVDAQGNVYGAIPGRRSLERHVKK